MTGRRIFPEQANTRGRERMPAVVSVAAPEARLPGGREPQTCVRRCVSRMLANPLAHSVSASRTHSDSFSDLNSLRQHSDSSREHSNSFREDSDSFSEYSQSFRGHSDSFRKYSDSLKKHWDSISEDSDSSGWINCIEGVLLEQQQKNTMRDSSLVTDFSN
jgi:hypothetical protein